MIYQIQEGCYSDLTTVALLDGPLDSDLDALQREWIDTSTLAPGAMNTSGFVLWLTNRPGWCEVGYETHNTGDCEPDGIDRLQALWGNKPRSAYTCHARPIHTTHYPHNYCAAYALDGRRVWRCSSCNEETEVTA